MRSGLATPPFSELVKDGLDRAGLAIVGLAEAACDGGVKDGPFVIVERIALVVDDEIQHRTVRQVRRLVNDETAISDDRAHTHARIAAGHRSEAMGAVRAGPRASSGVSRGARVTVSTIPPPPRPCPVHGAQVARRAGLGVVEAAEAERGGASSQPAALSERAPASGSRSRDGSWVLSANEMRPKPPRRTPAGQGSFVSRSRQSPTTGVRILLDRRLSSAARALRRCAVDALHQDALRARILAAGEGVHEAAPTMRYDVALRAERRDTAGARG